MRFELWVRFVAVWLGSLTCGADVRAQADAGDGSPVVTTVDPCVPIDQLLFRRLLSAELGTSIDYRAEAPQEPGRTWVHLSCARGGIALHLEDGITNKSMLRVLDAEPIAATDRTRLVAIAVAEFVIASWVELRAVPEPAVRAVGTEPAAQVNPVAAATIERRLSTVISPREPGSTAWEIAVGGGIDTYTSHAMIVPTASLRLVQSAVPLLAIVLGGDIGLVDVPVVRSELAAGKIQMLRASGLAALLLGGTVGDIALHAGPGIRFGVVRFSSRAELSGLKRGEFSKPHGGPLALGRLNYRFAPHFSVGLELELGAVTLPVEATVQDKVLLKLSGAWFSAGLRASALF